MSTEPIIPDLESMLRRKAQLPDAAQFFTHTEGETPKINPAWIAKQLPGIASAQLLLNSFMREQANDLDLKPTKQSEPSDLEREKLCRILFGNADIEVLKQIVTSIRSNSSYRMDMTLEEIDGATSLKIEHASPIPAETALDDKPPIPEPPVTVAVAGNGNGHDLSVLFDSARHKVKLLEGEKGSDEEILSAMLQGRWSRKVVMLMPTYSDINPHAMFTYIAQIKKQPWMGFEHEHGTVIQRSRNLLVQRFLKSEAEWSFWLDSDTIAPFGDPGFFFAKDRLHADQRFIKPEFAGLMAVERMMKAKRTIVGGMYNMRRAKAALVIQPNLHPKGAADLDTVKDIRSGGTQDKVVEVEYIATGCALIHRSVYLDIMKRHPERAPKKQGEPFDFFGHDVGVGGEDIAFCALAKDAGHKSYLDLAICCGHIGNFCFWPEWKQ